MASLSNQVYIGNISNDAREDDLRRVFGAVGPVRSVRLIYATSYPVCGTTASKKSNSKSHLDATAEALPKT